MSSQEGSATRSPEIGSQPDRLSDELERWLRSDAKKTVGSLIELFGPRSFAILFVILLAVPAIPAPTGGVTHVFEVIAMLLSLQLIANRDEIWLPRGLRERVTASGPDSAGMARLLKVVRWVEGMSRPRLTSAFGHRLSNVFFGAVVLVGSLAAFVAPPFTGLDTLPALGVLVLSLGVVLEDFAYVIAGVLILAAGVVLEITLGRAAYDLVGDLV